MFNCPDCGSSDVYSKELSPIWLDAPDTRSIESGCNQCPWRYVHVEPKYVKNTES
jgi:hypothetical protein